jgi:hypothetical protein
MTTAAHASPAPAARTAFALGGLAGNNAHGAGFLQAALDDGVTPLMISCTSGQIYWVAEYLKARHEQALQPVDDRDGPLRRTLAREITSLQYTGQPDLDMLWLWLHGKENRFRPAFSTYLQDWVDNGGAVMKSLLAGGGGDLHPFPLRPLLASLPGRLLVPEFPDSFFADIATVFNGTTDIGIAFNAYSPCEGTEHVYLNERARALLGERGEGADKYRSGHRNAHRRSRVYRDIDAQAVRSALWLYMYGFEAGTNFVDGAYFRGVMLAELVPADTIIAVRPINHRWLSALPKNYPDRRDLETEVGFNGGYAAERAQIELINKLLQDQALDPQRPAGLRYHPITLHELEIGEQRGFFDYALEGLDVFDHAARTARDSFLAWGLVPETEPA